MTTLSALNIYPIKSCGGIALSEALVSAQGLTADRNWMVVGKNGRFLSQREYPSMAAITVVVEGESISVSAPGMPALQLTMQGVGTVDRVHVTIWDDTVIALDCGAQMHQWFSDYLRTDARLVRFDAAVERICSQRWTGDIRAATQFADGFPLLVIGQASLQDLNRRMQSKGAPVIPMQRFRPNIVIAGLAAYEEDYIDTLTIGEADKAVILKLVKPCVRCAIPGIDQCTGLRDPDWPEEPLDTMAGYRATARVGGGLTFGQNAIVVQGSGRRIRLGDMVRYDLAF